MPYTPPPSQHVTQLLTTDYDAMLAWIATQESVIEDLEIEIERLKNPTTPPQAGRIFGFTIENSQKTPSAIEYTKNKSAMDWGKRIGFNTYRIFLNPTEMRNMAAGTGTLENIIAYGTSLGLMYVADTMDTICKMLPLESSLRAYCDAGMKLGWKGVCFNDADRDSLPIATLRAMVGRVRLAAPGILIYGSLMGTADIALYGQILDRVEIQTFGTDSELVNYLAIDAIPCLDLRSPLTTEQLKAKAAIIKRNPPRDLYYYADLNSDYENMPDSEDAVIRDLLQTLQAL